MNELFDEVNVWLDAFSMLILNWVFGELVGTLIVAPKLRQMLLLESKI
jgi:hypothetical protein